MTETESEKHKTNFFFYHLSCNYKMFVYVHIQRLQNQEEILMDIVS